MDVGIVCDATRKRTKISQVSASIYASNAVFRSNSPAPFAPARSRGRRIWNRISPSYIGYLQSQFYTFRRRCKYFFLITAIKKSEECPISGSADVLPRNRFALEQDTNNVKCDQDRDRTRWFWGIGLTIIPDIPATPGLYSSIMIMSQIFLFVLLRATNLRCYININLCTSRILSLEFWNIEPTTVNRFFIHCFQTVHLFLRFCSFFRFGNSLTKSSNGCPGLQWTRSSGRQSFQDRMLRIVPRPWKILRQKGDPTRQAMSRLLHE